MVNISQMRWHNSAMEGIKDLVSPETPYTLLYLPREGITACKKL